MAQVTPFILHCLIGPEYSESHDCESEVHNCRMAVILVTVKEAAEHFDVHRATIYRWIKDKRLGVVKLRGKRYLVYDEVERLMEQRR